MNYKDKRRIKIESYFPKPVQGRGLLNSIINNLPFEAHVPGYQYLGPGTNLDLKLEKKVTPKNKLDEAAMYHDIAYSKSKDLKDRHVADYKLEQDAWKRVKAPDASFGEKTAAWLTTTAMKTKQALGAGIAKSQKTTTSYVKYPINLNEADKISLLNAADNKKGVDVDVYVARTKNSIMNETYAPLTRYQIKKIKAAQKNNNVSTKIKLSARQVQRFKQGGFLPALLAAAPVVAGVLSTLYNSYNNKKTNDRLIEEKIRHHRALEKGSGLYMSRKPKALKGNGLRKQKGKGLYMSRKPKSLEGNGLLQELFKKKKTLR